MRFRTVNLGARSGYSFPIREGPMISVKALENVSHRKSFASRLYV